MIKDVFQLPNWKVTIFYESTCNDIDYIVEALEDINCPSRYIREAIHNLETCNLNIGLTYSNTKLKSSIIVINKTSSFGQLLNTISHEYFHLIFHIAKTLKIDNEEELATLNGNLNMRSFDFLQKMRKVDF